MNEKLIKTALLLSIIIFGQLTAPIFLYGFVTRDTLTDSGIIESYEYYDSGTFGCWTVTIIVETENHGAISFFYYEPNMGAFEGISEGDYVDITKTIYYDKYSMGWRIDGIGEFCSSSKVG